MPTKPPSNKILIVISYWKGDRESAMRLSRLMADLQPERSDLADILFCARFDCPHDLATMKYVARKFNVYTMISKRRGTGWPHGCNELFFGMLEWVYHKKESGQIPNYKAIFIVEADCVPMATNWIQVLHREWDIMNTGKRICVSGVWLPHGPHGVGHINGNLILSGDLKFLFWLAKRVGGAPVTAGWDWLYAKDFHDRGWSPCPGMVFRWQCPTITESEYLDETRRGTFWFHGVKDGSALQLSRKILLGEKV